jgi:VanZ family protein
MYRMNWPSTRQKLVIRILAWLGIAAIVVLTVVPAADRPVTGAGQVLEHFAAYALVAGSFALAYRVSLTWLMLLAFLFCGLTELMQVPLATRHARLSDFIIDLAGACMAVWMVCSINARLNPAAANRLKET